LKLVGTTYLKLAVGRAAFFFEKVRYSCNLKNKLIIKTKELYMFEKVVIFAALKKVNTYWLWYIEPVTGIQPST
jgi:hypothetical protein